MRQRERSMRRICGAAESSASISGSDSSRCWSWLREHATAGIRRRSQANLLGRRGGRGDARRALSNGVRKPSPRAWSGWLPKREGRGRGFLTRARVGERRVPAWTRTAIAAKRMAMRRSLFQSRNMSGAAVGPLGWFAAIARHSPSMMRSKRSVTVCAGARVTNKIRTHWAEGFQLFFGASASSSSSALASLRSWVSKPSVNQA